MREKSLKNCSKQSKADLNRYHYVQSFSNDDGDDDDDDVRQQQKIKKDQLFKNVQPRDKLIEMTALRRARKILYRVKF